MAYGVKLAKLIELGSGHKPWGGLHFVDRYRPVNQEIRPPRYVAGEITMVAVARKRDLTSVSDDNFIVSMEGRIAHNDSRSNNRSNHNVNSKARTLEIHLEPNT